VNKKAMAAERCKKTVVMMKKRPNVKNPPVVGEMDFPNKK
jgi:hypothetical protein